MKKGMCLLTCLIVAAVVFSPVVSAIAAVTYEIEDLMSIDIPDDYYVFTREEMDDNDLKELGLERNAMENIFETNNIFLNAIDKELPIEIVITMTDNIINDMSDYLTDESSQSAISEVEDAYADVGVEVLKGEVYQHLQDKYMKIYLKQANNGAYVYSLQYYTIASHKAINITLHSYSGKKITAVEEAKIKEIVDSAIIERTAQTDLPQTTTQTHLTQTNTYSSSATKLANTYIARIIGILLWSLIPGFIAKHKNRSFFGYYFLSLIITPLIGMIITLCLKKVDDTVPNNGAEEKAELPKVNKATPEIGVAKKNDTVPVVQEREEVPAAAVDETRDSKVDSTEDLCNEPSNASDDEESDNQIRFCHKCGNKLFEGSIYCNKCGTKMP